MKEWLWQGTGTVMCGRIAWRLKGRIHSGYGAGSINNERKRLIDFAMASDMALLNIFYCKRDTATYARGE